MTFANILTPEGRRAWAFAAICGGCGVFTLFAAVAVYLVAGNALYSLILGLTAHLQILVGMTALGWTLGRRMMVDVTRAGAKISDRDDVPAAAQAVADAAQEQADVIKDVK